MGMGSRVGAVLFGLLLGLGVGVASAAPVVLEGGMDASQVVDGVSTSPAKGFARLTLLPDEDRLTLDLAWTGLTGPADRSHLHDAPEGVSRTVYDPLDLLFDEVIEWMSPLRVIDCDAWHAGWMCVGESGSLHFEQTFADMLQYCPPGNGVIECTVAGMREYLLRLVQEDAIYIDLHTQAFPAGEIRGQLSVIPEPATWMLALPLAWGLRRRRRA